MAQSASHPRQYFLGIDGKQTGPFTEPQVIKMIHLKEVAEGTLIWYEGLPEWQPIQSIVYFKEEFGKIQKPNTPKPLVANDEEDEDNAVTQSSPIVKPQKKPVRKESEGAEKEEVSYNQMTTFAKSADSMSPVFSNEEGKFSSGGNPKRKMALTIVGAVLLCIFGGSAYVLMTGFEGTLATIPELEKKAAMSPRETEGRKALTELLLTPDVSVKALEKLAKEDSEDAIGKDAVNAVLEYYRQRMRHSDAGNFLMAVKRPEDAYKQYLISPPAYRQAEEALFAHYQTTKKPNKEELLISDIQLLLGPLNNLPLAVERIRLFEKDFPGKTHPFGFYLKSVDQKAFDLFQRIAFYYVQNLLNFLSTEFPQMKLAKRPLIEIKKDKGGMYRIVGSYRGEVLLNQDQLKDITFTFWYYNSEWSLVDTNITVERRKYSLREKQKRQTEALSADALLESLQSVFKMQFPQKLLHDTVSLDSQTKPPKKVAP